METQKLDRKINRIVPSHHLDVSKSIEQCSRKKIDEADFRYQILNFLENNLELFDALIVTDAQRKQVIEGLKNHGGIMTSDETGV